MVYYDYICKNVLLDTLKNMPESVVYEVPHTEALCDVLKIYRSSFAPDYDMTRRLENGIFNSTISESARPEWEDIPLKERCKDAFFILADISWQRPTHVKDDILIEYILTMNTCCKPDILEIYSNRMGEKQEWYLALEAALDRKRKRNNSENNFLSSIFPKIDFQKKCIQMPAFCQESICMFFLKTIGLRENASKYLDYAQEWTSGEKTYEEYVKSEKSSYAKRFSEVHEVVFNCISLEFKNI